MNFPDTRTTFQIVGVTKDDRDHRLRGDIPRRFYIPFFQGLGGIPPAGNFEIRTFADPNSVIRMIRQQVEQVDRSLPILSASPLGELLDRRLTQERLLAQLCAFFGALALLLASVGLYGVLSYSIARRTNEIGIRMALGAQRRTVLGMVLRETAVVVAVGIAIGVPVAFASHAPGRQQALWPEGDRPADHHTRQPDTRRRRHACRLSAGTPGLASRSINCAAYMSDGS